MANRKVSEGRSVYVKGFKILPFFLHGSFLNKRDVMYYTDFARNTIGLVSFVIRNVVVLYGGNGICCFLSQILLTKDLAEETKASSVHIVKDCTIWCICRQMGTDHP